LSRSERARSGCSGQLFIIESSGGIGLLWFAGKQFQNFVLRVDWRASAQDDNSGVFIRFPDPGNDWTIPVAQGYEIQIDNAGKNPDTNPPTFGDPLHRHAKVGAESVYLLRAVASEHSRADHDGVEGDSAIGVASSQVLQM
jgi:hypothetical protein